MESRNIALTLEKAREWYNSDNADLREVALQAYTKEELEEDSFTKIRSFNDAVRELGMCETKTSQNIRYIYNLDLPFLIKTHLIAIYKLDIICRALNGKWIPKVSEGKVYYPYIRIYSDIKAPTVNLGKSFISDGKKYTLTGVADVYNSPGVGMIDEFGISGRILSDIGIYGCKSMEIAQHMSVYFQKEIFDAAYGRFRNTYNWE